MKDNKCGQVILDSLKTHKFRVALLIMLCFMGALLPSLTPLVYRQIVDNLIPNKNFSTLFIYVFALVGIPICSSLLNNWLNIVAYKISDVVTRNLRGTLFNKIVSLNYGAFQRVGIKALESRITRGCGQVGDVFLINTLLSLINASFSLIMVLIPMLILEWHLAFIALLAFPIVYVVLVRVKKHVAGNDKKLFQVLMEGDRIFFESLEGMRVMRVSGGKERQTKKIDGWMQEHLKAKQTSVTAHEFERVSLPELCLQILYGLIFILSAIFVMQGNMTIGELVAFVAYIPRALSSIKGLLLIEVNYKSVEPYFQSINEILAMPDEYSGAILPKTQGDISFRNVCFQYTKEAGFAIQNMNFDIHRNEAVAIVGETGGGKSTLLDLLLRFYEPSAGEILLDGVNIREYDLNAYRALFAVSEQNPFLWNDTVSANITYPDENSRPDEYEQAVEKAQLTEFLKRLPQGDQAALGECGQSLSGGERQRIGLAHAFYMNRSILLMDEPTSALDADTESRLREAILSYKGKKTIIVVTHRLSNILEFDRVLVIKNGKIVENGKPEELLACASVFRDLCEKQGCFNDTRCD